jgi:GTPase SAR1 family protein
MDKLEMGNCKFIIQCNPYEKTIKFKRCDEKNEWQPIDAVSPLMKYEKGSHAIQNCAKEIIEGMVTYTKKGKSVCFQGTITDYEDFKNKLAYLQKNGRYTGIEIVFDEKNKLPEAPEAISEIEDAYQKFQSEMAKFYSSDRENESSEGLNAIVNHLKKYKEITKPELVICVIGTFSSGKSTFINALIGEELLPSNADPTTARVAKIRNGQLNQIGFTYKNIDFTMRWDRGTIKYYPLDGTDSIIDKLNVAIKGKLGVVSQMNAVIELLNHKYDKDGQITDEVLAQISDSIDVVVKYNNPFISNDEFACVIIDTPGSNSATYGEKHSRILKESIADQTNSLPILIVERNSLDSRDNKELDDMLNEFSSFDYTYKLVVINQADNLPLETIKQKISSEIMEARRFDRLLFVSSIIALGSRKNGSKLINPSYKEIFSERKASFLNNKELYCYAILPDDEKKQIEKESKEYAANEENLLLVNSGIYAVEYEIKEFASKYLYYLKAKESNNHLLKAFELLQQELEQAKQILEDKLEKYRYQREAKKEVLVNQIRNARISESMIEDIRTRTMKFFDGYVDDFISKNLKPQTRSFHDQIKKRKDLTKSEANKTYHKYLIDYCNDFYQEKFPAVTGAISGGLTRLADQYKNSIIDIIESDEDLTTEAKKRIKDIKMTPPPFEPTFNKFVAEGAFPKQFWLFGQRTIRPGSYLKRLQKVFKSSFRQDVIENPYKQMKKELTDWLGGKEEETISKIDTSNLDLKQWDDRISDQKKKITNLEGVINRLSETEERLSKLLTFKESGE